MKHLLTLTFLSIFGLTHAQVPFYVPTNGLVGWWPFNGNANDESGNGNNGTVNGATLTADRNGVANRAYSFDGVNDYITGFVNNSNLSDLSFSVWVNTQNTSAGTFIHLGSDNGSPYCNGVSLGNFSAPSSNLVGHYPCIGFFNSSASFTNNQWSLCTMVKLNNILFFYVNGILLSQISTNGFNSPDNNFWFGSTYSNYISFYSGSLDDIGIWNRALTEAEILDLYESCQLAIISQPQAQNVTTSVGVANFSVTSSASNPTYQWQTNLGLGFQNISNAGQYNGATTSSLTVSNLSLSNNNQVFRCIVNDGSCVDTTAEASLTIIDDAGIQTNTLTSLKLYPNPVLDVLHIDGLAGKEFEFEVLSIDGKLLQKGKSQGEISVTELHKGNYVLRVGQQQVSFVKQ